MRKRRFFGAVAGGMLLASMVTGPAWAANDQGGCPDGGGWFLGPADLIIEDIDNGNFHDQNGDGLVCANVNKGQSKKLGGESGVSWTVKDNTNPLP